MVGSQLVFANGTSAGTITAFNSSNSLTVSTSQTVSSQAYSIAYTGLQVGTAGNVGIGTTSPNTTLTVAGDVRMTGANSIYFGASGSSAGSIGVTDASWGPIYLSSSNGVVISNSLRMANSNITSNEDLAVGPINNNRLLTLRSSGTGNIVLSPGGAEKIRIDSSGNVGIGTTSPGYKLDVVGDINSSTALRFAGTSVCTISGCTTSSDRTLKENIKPLTNSLENILKLQGVGYDWKDKKKYNDNHQVGLIAQDLEKIYPEVVVTDLKSGLKSVAYDHLIAPLIEAFKELNKRFMAFYSEFRTLLARVLNIEQKQVINERAIASKADLLELKKLEEKSKILESNNESIKKKFDIETRALKRENELMKAKLQKIEKLLQKIK